MRDVISRIVDGSRLREFKKEYGPTIITVSNINLVLHSIPTRVCVRVSRIYMGMKLA